MQHRVQDRTDVLQNHPFFILTPQRISSLPSPLQWSMAAVNETPPEGHC